jgi:hypothetical protein
LDGSIPPNCGVIAKGRTDKFSVNPIRKVSRKGVHEKLTMAVGRSEIAGARCRPSSRGEPLLLATQNIKNPARAVRILDYERARVDDAPFLDNDDQIPEDYWDNLITFVPKCWCCGSNEHVTVECKERPSCWCCGSYKHGADDCNDRYNYNKLQQIQKSGILLPRSIVACSYCGSFKHNKNRCNDTFNYDKWMSEKAIKESHVNVDYERFDDYELGLIESFESEEDENFYCGTGVYKIKHCHDEVHDTDCSSSDSCVVPGNLLGFKEVPVYCYVCGSKEHYFCDCPQNRNKFPKNNNNNSPVGSDSEDIIIVPNNSPVGPVNAPKVPVDNKSPDGILSTDLFDIPIGYKWEWFENYDDHVTICCTMTKTKILREPIVGDGRPDCFVGSELLHPNPVYVEILYERRPVVRFFELNNKHRYGQYWFSKETKLIVSEEMACQLLIPQNATYQMEPAVIFSRITQASKTIAKVNANRCISLTGSLVPNDTTIFACNLVKFYFYERRNLVLGLDFIR